MSINELPQHHTYKTHFLKKKTKQKAKTEKFAINHINKCVMHASMMGQVIKHVIVLNSPHGGNEPPYKDVCLKFIVKRFLTICCIKNWGASYVCLNMDSRCLIHSEN